MAIPPTAKIFDDKLDPQEEIDFQIDLASLVESGEEIATGDWTLEVLAEGAALGLEIMTGGGRDPSLIDGTLIRFWLSIDILFQANEAFDDSGTDLPLRITAGTTVTPQRTRQRTFQVHVEHQ